MSPILRASLVGSLFALVSFVATADRAAAQCGPDGISGGCCVPVTPHLPFFPNVVMPGTSICWTGCVVANQVGTKIDWTPPVPLSCTEYITTLTVTDLGSGLPIMSGPMVLDYTRTWDEIDPSGGLHQVWRFVAKADLSVVPLGVVWNCEAPNCIPPLGPNPHAFYYGYVDYSHDCAVGSQFLNSIVLHHACDFFIHKPGLSATPGVFHPNRSYAIVGPHSTSQPFLPNNQLVPSSPFFGEATRDIGSFVPPLCFDEDPIVSGQTATLGGACLTSFTIGPKQHTIRRFDGKGSCINSAGLNGNFQALNFSFPNLPWFYLVSASMGTWQNGNVWPGKQHAWVDEGLFIHQNACTGDWVDINYGATTKGGWMILHPLPITQMTDLADNYTAPLFGPYPFPILGTIQPTQKLIYTQQL